MILNLIIVVLLLLRKVKKSVFFWGQPFSYMVKIKLFLYTYRFLLNRTIFLREIYRYIWNQTEWETSILNKVILGRHKILCITEFKSICWECTFIQTNRWTIFRQSNPKEKLDMGRVSNKLGKHSHDPRQQGNTSAHHSSSTTPTQIEWEEFIWEKRSNAHILHVKAMKVIVQSRVWERITIISEATSLIVASNVVTSYTYSCKTFLLEWHSTQSLNANCDLTKYLFCQMPAGALEVQIKVKTTWGKFTMVQDTHTRMEKYHMWEKTQRCTIKSRKRRTPCKMTSMQTDNDAMKRIYLQVKSLVIHHKSSLTTHTQQHQKGKWKRKESL